MLYLNNHRKIENNKVHKEQRSSAKNFLKWHRYRAFHLSNHQKWLSYQIQGGKTVKKVQTDPQTTDIWSQS